MLLERSQVIAQRPDVAAQQRSGQRGVDAQPLGVGQRLPGQRDVDGERRGLVEAGSLGDASRSRRAGRPGRRRPSSPPRGKRSCHLRAASPACAPIDSARSASSGSSDSSPSTATVEPARSASARSWSANATSGWKLPALVPAAIAGSQDGRRQRAAGVDECLAAVQVQRCRRRRRWRHRARSGRSGPLRRARCVDRRTPRTPGTSCVKRSRRASSRLATAVTSQPACLKATASTPLTRPAPMNAMRGLPSSSAGAVSCRVGSWRPSPWIVHCRSIVGSHESRAYTRLVTSVATRGGHTRQVPLSSTDAWWEARRPDAR